MTSLLNEGVLVAIIAFARIGGCFLVIPVFSGMRVPVQVRILLVFTLTMALVPIVWTNIVSRIPDDLPGMLLLIGLETLTGFFIGIIARIFILAIGFIGNAIAMTIGFSGLPGVAIDGSDPEAALSALISMAALTLLLILDFHHTIIAGLVTSYDAIEVGDLIDPRMLLVNIADTMHDAFLLVLRLASPFIAYALIANFMVGLLNKLTPQIPIYFVSLPFIIAGGLMLLYFGIPSFLRLFLDGYQVGMRGILN